MYKILKMEGRAKRAHMETVHGNIETPVFMNVGTAAAIKGAVSTEDLQQIGTQVELSNTYHLHVRPGDEVVKKMGGLHKFMVWDKPILTDSGGFQVFSLAGLRKIKEEDGEILGYLGILISFDESEITNVCVAEKARRRGIGHALMEELFRRMQERKVRVIHLDVRIGNTPARNLYESLGFVQDGLRKGYYDLPKEDAVLMSRTDESVPKR